MNGKWMVGIGMAVTMLGMVSAAQAEIEESKTFYFHEFDGNVEACKKIISYLGDKAPQPFSNYFGYMRTRSGNSIRYEEAIRKSHCHFSRYQHRTICSRDEYPTTTKIIEFTCHNNGSVDISYRDLLNDNACKEGNCIRDNLRSDIQFYKKYIIKGLHAKKEQSLLKSAMNDARKFMESELANHHQYPTKAKLLASLRSKTKFRDIIIYQFWADDDVFSDDHPYSFMLALDGSFNPYVIVIDTRKSMEPMGSWDYRRGG